MHVRPGTRIPPSWLVPFLVAAGLAMGVSVAMGRSGADASEAPERLTIASASAEFSERSTGTFAPSFRRVRELPLTPDAPEILAEFVRSSVADDSRDESKHLASPVTTARQASSTTTSDLNATTLPTSTTLASLPTSTVTLAVAPPRSIGPGSANSSAPAAVSPGVYRLQVETQPGIEYKYRVFGDSATGVVQIAESGWRGGGFSVDLSASGEQKLWWTAIARDGEGNESAPSGSLFLYVTGG